MQSEWKAGIVGWILGGVTMAIFLWFWKYFSMDSNTVTAIATVVLAIITGAYVRLTNSILEEQRITRKINEIEKKLVDFYYPFKKDVIFFKKGPDVVNSRSRLDTQDYMKHVYLCQNKNIRMILKKILDDPDWKFNLQDFENLEKHADEDIETFIKKYYELSG